MTEEGCRQLANHVRTHRKRLRLSQEKFAWLLDVSTKLISQIETARQPNLSPGTLSLLDGELGWTPGTARGMLCGESPRRSEAMSKQQLTVTYVSPGGEEVDWWTQATGPDDAAAIEKCLKQFRQAHVAGLKITELRVQDMSGDRLVS